MCCSAFRGEQKKTVVLVEIELNLLQCVAGVLQRIALRCNHGSALQRVAVRCSVLQCVAVF